MQGFEKVKDAVDLRVYVEEHLERSGRKYACPFCGSGSKRNKTSAFQVGQKRFACFACGAKGDIFDLIGRVEGITDKADQLKAAAQYAGLPVAGCVAEPKTKPDDRPGASLSPDLPPYSSPLETAPSAVSYLASRGISLDMAKRFRLGYDDRNDRLVIPFPGSASYHIDRDLSGAPDKKYVKPSRQVAGPQPVWNPEALEGDDFLVVEGPFDAMAAEELGFPAVALCGTGQGQLLEALRAVRYSGRILVALDNDEPGKRAQEKLVETLREAGFDASPVDYPSWWPTDSDNADLSAMFAKDAAKAGEWLSEVRRQAARNSEESREARSADILAACGVVDPAKVLDMLEEGACAIEAVPTGLEGLDDILDGGLRPALYVLGAQSSMGKTTLALQIADHVAASGGMVLFVTCEMSSRELVAKSVSRLARELCGVSIFPVEVMDPALRTRRGKGREESLARAAGEYRELIAPNMRILEPKVQPSVAEIRDVTAALAQRTGTAPLVVVDYIQLLAPMAPHLTDKQAVDGNVLALRQLARDLETPVLAVSSLNRSAYGAPVAFDSFKESGGLEYGADVLLGLQPAGIRSRRGRQVAAEAAEQCRAADVRSCELVVLKNRSGRVSQPGEGIALRYDAGSGLFECRGNQKTVPSLGNG